jgi:hypothetical protein
MLSGNFVSMGREKCLAILSQKSLRAKKLPGRYELAKD